MTFSVRLCRCAFALLLIVGLSGCLPSISSQDEEEKEPHFLAGKRLVSVMDYGGAVDEFQKALEVNPHNGSAHYELALLFDGRQQDPAAAIFHYQEFLKLHPTYEQSSLVRQRIEELQAGPGKNRDAAGVAGNAAGVGANGGRDQAASG